MQGFFFAGTLAAAVAPPLVVQYLEPALPLGWRKTSQTVTDDHLVLNGPSAGALDAESTKSKSDKLVRRCGPQQNQIYKKFKNTIYIQIQ